MKHVPEDDVRVATTVLGSTRWGLRTGLTRADYDEIRAQLHTSSEDAPKAPIRKPRHGRRTVIDCVAELEVPQDQIGAAWLAPDPIYSHATFYEGSQDLPPHQALWDFHVAFEESEDPPQNPEDMVLMDHDVDWANQLPASPTMWLNPRSPSRRVVITNARLSSRVLEARSDLFRKLKDQLRENQQLLPHVRPLVIAMAMKTLAVDGRPILLNEEDAEPLPDHERSLLVQSIRSTEEARAEAEGRRVRDMTDLERESIYTDRLGTLLLLDLIADNLVGEAIRRQIRYEGAERRRVMQGRLQNRRTEENDEERPHGVRLTPPAKETGTAFSPEYDGPKPPRGPNPWHVLRDFCIEVFNLMHEVEERLAREESSRQAESWFALYGHTTTTSPATPEPQKPDIAEDPLDALLKEFFPG